MFLCAHTGNRSPQAGRAERAERERKVAMRLHRGAPANVSSSDLTARLDQSRITTSQVGRLALCLSIHSGLVMDIQTSPHMQQMAAPPRAWFCRRFVPDCFLPTILCLCYFEVGQSSERKLIFILASLHWLLVIEF